MKMWAARALVCAASVAPSGCTVMRSAVVHVDVLPGLAESASRYPEGWHDTIDAVGKPVTLKGRVDSITVARPGLDPGDTFKVPFRATVAEGELLLSDARHEHAY